MFKVSRKVLGQLLIGVGLSFSLSVPARAEDQVLMVSAAASLKNVMEELAPIFQKQNPQVKLTFNFGASGALQQQIEQGAPVDLFISAAQKPMDDLKAKDLLNNDSISPLLGNSLVLITAKDKIEIKSLNDLEKVRRIAVGESKTVPAGQYAEEALKNLKLFAALQSKLVPAANVRQVLTFVETANVDAGFVYATDALESSKVRVVVTLDSKLHAPIVYPVGIIKKTKNPAQAKLFREFLRSSEARKVFQDKGFVLPQEKAS